MEAISIDQIRWQKRLKRFFTYIPIILLLIILAMSSVFKVNTGEAAVITQFGRVARVVQDAGIHMKLPVVEAAHKVSLAKRHQIEYGYRTLRSPGSSGSPEYMDVPEEQTVIVEAVGNNSSLVLTEMIVEYRVSNPVNYLFKVDDLEGTIRLVLEDTLRNTLQTVTLNQALTDKLTIDAEIKPELQRMLNSYEAGIEIIEVKTQNTSLLPSVDTAYREIERANQYRNSKIEEAQKYKNTVVPKAEAEAIQLIEDAKAYKARVIAQAKADVAEFNALYAEYAKNPEIIREKIYTESMQEFITNNNIIIDTTSDSNLYKFYNMEDVSEKTSGKSSSSNAEKVQAVIEEEGAGNE
jgi:membrane protease subunit HflK